MQELLDQLAVVIERGKVDINAAYPPDMAGQEGASELTKKLLDMNVPATDILEKSLMAGMQKVGDKFGSGQAFIPDLLIAAKAMNAAMAYLESHFKSGELKHKGTFVIGTVTGDLHDIGKNLVRMVLEGNGWKVVDLGTDAGSDKFLEALDENPDSLVGLSALLTTTMVNMESIVRDIKSKYPQTKIYVGGAPVTDEFSAKIKADGYFTDPQRLAEHLKLLQVA
jgi:5-methyltetrahydrofolate--homocysteine methyltransferase